MKLITFVSLLALAIALPQSKTSAADKHFKILRDDRVHPEDGKYSFNFETENGIVRSESGARLTNVEGKPVGQQGQFTFPLPDGQTFTLKFVANENGFVAESPFLPVAPEFPHPIPQFVLDQIEKAAREDAETSRKG